MTDEKLTNLQEDERSAMCLDRAAVLRVVSALRAYRAASRKLLGARYSDGFVDGAATTSFECEIEEIESAGGD
jgi:hypothetical protein